MNVMSRFTLRSMKVNRKWTVVTIIGIIISTAMIAAVSSFCESFVELMRNETIAMNGNWHAMVSDVRLEDVSAFEDEDFVDEVSLHREIGYAALTGSKNTDKPYLYIRQFDENSYKNFPVELVEGHMPQNDSELVLSQHIETNGGVKYKIGDTIALDVGKRMSSDGYSFDQNVPFQGESNDDSEGEALVTEQTRTYTVVGIIERPRFEPTWAPGYTVLSYLDTSALNPDDTMTVTLLSRSVNRKIFDNIKTLAKSAGLDDSHTSYNTDLLRYYGVDRNDNVQNTIYSFAGVFIAIIIIASVSLIYNAFAISISERVSQLGMLASIGATKHQKRKSVYFEGFILGMIGIPLGIAFGIAGIGVTLAVIRPLMESFSDFSSAGLTLHVSLQSIAVAAVLAAFTIFISVWIPARRASKIMPIDAIRQSKEVKLTRKAVKTSRLTRALFGFEGEIALKNLKRNRKKYRATVLSLIISLVLFLTVSYYAEEMTKASDAIETGYNYDIAVLYTNVSEGEVRDVNKKIEVLEDVKEITSAKRAMGVFHTDGSQLSDLSRQLFAPNGEDFFLGASIYCLDDTSFDKYAMELGVNPEEYRDREHPKIILINYGQAYDNGKKAAGKLLDVKEGEILSVSRDAADEITEENYTDLQAGMLTDKRPMGVLVSPLSNISVVVSREVYDVLPDKMKSIYSDGNQSFSNLFLTTENPDTVETQIQELTKNIFGGTSVYNIASNARSERNMMLVLGIFIYGFITLISLISIANIFNTVTTNIALRRREFAMLRSVGMTPGSFNKMIRFESIFYGLKALLYGLPISVTVSLLLHKMQADVFEIGFSMPWKSYGVAVVLIFLIVGVTMLYSSAKIKKENIINALKAGSM